MTHTSKTTHEFHAALFSWHLTRLRESLEHATKAGYKPNQPRAPRGMPNGGQWVGYGGTPPFGYEANPYYEPTGATEPPPKEEIIAAGSLVISIVFGYAAVARWAAAQAIPKTRWTLGKHKGTVAWKNRVGKGGWTDKKINEALKKGEQHPAPNNVNKQNTATRYVHPKTKQSIVRDDVTEEILHLGEDKYNYDPK